MSIKVRVPDEIAWQAESDQRAVGCLPLICDNDLCSKVLYGADVLFLLSTTNLFFLSFTRGHILKGLARVTTS